MSNRSCVTVRELEPSARGTQLVQANALVVRKWQGKVSLSALIRVALPSLILVALPTAETGCSSNSDRASAVGVARGEVRGQVVLRGLTGNARNTFDWSATVTDGPGGTSCVHAARVPSLDVEDSWCLSTSEVAEPIAHFVGRRDTYSVYVILASDGSEVAGFSAEPGEVSGTGGVYTGAASGVIIVILDGEYRTVLVNLETPDGPRSVTIETDAAASSPSA